MCSKYRIYVVFEVCQYFLWPFLDPDCIERSLKQYICTIIYKISPYLYIIISIIITIIIIIIFITVIFINHYF